MASHPQPFPSGWNEGRVKRLIENYDRMSDDALSAEDEAYRDTHAQPVSLPTQLRTERLLLRRWREEDRGALAAMNADPRVMEHFPSVLSREASDALFDRIQAHWRERGFGLFAVEVLGEAPFAGFVGLAVPRFEAHFTPCVEIGWRLAAEFWGRGLATEGARGALEFAFSEKTVGGLALDEVVSFTARQNVRSRRVMERIGMRHDAAGDFDHPLLPAGHRLARHVLYRISRAGNGGREAVA